MFKGYMTNTTYTILEPKLIGCIMVNLHVMYMSTIIKISWHTINNRIMANWAFYLYKANGYLGKPIIKGSWLTWPTIYTRFIVLGTSFTQGSLLTWHIMYTRTRLIANLKHHLQYVHS